MDCTKSCCSTEVVKGVPRGSDYYILFSSKPAFHSFGSPTSSPSKAFVTTATVRKSESELKAIVYSRISMEPPNRQRLGCGETGGATERQKGGEGDRKMVGKRR